MDATTGLTHFLQQTNEAGRFVFALLLLMSAASWTVIVVRVWRSSLARTHALKTMRAFCDQRPVLEHRPHRM